ncbi:MAG TPA: RdgB/HAM1 family non-canonical purine NTP pyrophosphatase [Candidatus Methanomethylophilaceae archaeon]|nr:RdgB/HAM1 family non-canonical purine NTP pyrophosphatase [Candidatus Methanomethylophilaceae archaeon]
MKIKIITSNPGKVIEFREEFSRLGIEMEHFPYEYDEIQSSDLEEVVIKGMESLRSKGLSDFIIDDTGLFIDGLKGFPGVWSAYVQNTIGSQGILKLLEDSESREAEFRTCMGCDLGGETIIVTGVCRGHITKEETGSEGFGYDSIFTHDGKRTFAELPADLKNSISHRGKAIRSLVEEVEKHRSAEAERF